MIDVGSSHLRELAMFGIRTKVLVVARQYSIPQLNYPTILLRYKQFNLYKW